MTIVQRAQTHTRARLENDYCTTCTNTHTHTTRERLLYDVHIHAQLENDYYTTTVRYAQTDIDRYRYTHTHIHTHTTHTTHTHTTQEAANYVVAKVRRVG
jgi:hypothetical protein